MTGSVHHRRTTSLMRRAVWILAVFALACGEGRQRSMPQTPDGTSDAELRIRGYTLPYELETGLPGAGLTWLIVDLDVLARGSRPVSASFAGFSLETDRASYAALESTGRLDNGCTGNAIATPTQSRYCRLAFSVTIGELPAKLYLNDNGVTTVATFDGVSGPQSLCATRGPEDTIAACTDGCNNDGDGYMDCEERECCPLIGGCPSTSYCGRNQPQCVRGAEGEPFTTCLDRCDNDGDGAMDCNEAACCDVLACGAQTVCGVMGDPFSGQLQLDDNAVRALNPDTLLAGDAPCHPPSLVAITRVPDGDTMRISSIDGGGLDGLIRLIGVDTPEVGRNGEPSDCYAAEAAAFARQLDGHLAWVTFDAECRDQYDRYLGYLHLGPNREDMFERQLVRRGLARVYTVSGNDSLAELFSHDYAVAASDRVGLHAACQ